MKADLIGLKINTFINGILVSSNQFECLRDMSDNFLFSMDFDDLIFLLPDEWREYYYALLERDNAAEKFPPIQEGIKAAKEKFPSGTRIQLDEMPRDPQLVPANTLGTVQYVDDAGHLHMRWDNGRSLSLVPGVDKFHVVREK